MDSEEIRNYPQYITTKVQELVLGSVFLFQSDWLFIYLFIHIISGIIILYIHIKWFGDLTYGNVQIQ